MGKLHQLLAVEPDLDGAYKNVLQETQVVFEKKARQKANSCDVVKTTIGAKLMDYINLGQ